MNRRPEKILLSRRHVNGNKHSCCRHTSYTYGINREPMYTFPLTRIKVMTYVRDLIPELIVELDKSLIKLLKMYLGKSHHKIIIKFI